MPCIILLFVQLYAQLFSTDILKFHPSEINCVCLLMCSHWLDTYHPAIVDRFSYRIEQHPSVQIFRNYKKKISLMISPFALERYKSVTNSAIH